MTTPDPDGSSTGRRAGHPPGSDAAYGGVTDAVPAARPNFGRLLRIGFLLVVFVFAVIWVWGNRHQVGAAWSRVKLWPVVGAFLAGAVSAWSIVPAWREMLIGLGSRLGLRDAQRVFLMGQLGKYIPGGVWTVVAQATMARELDVPRTRSGTASLMTILLAVVTSAGLGAICLGVAGQQVIGRYGWWLLLVLPVLALLHPGVLVWAGTVAERITRRKFPLQRIPETKVLAAAGLLLVGQVFNGLAFYLLVGSISGRYANPLLSIGLFSFAAAIGILVVFAPAGAGAREIILAFGLAGVTDPGSIVLIVLMSRVVLTVVDVALAAAAAGIGRRPSRAEA